MDLNPDTVNNDRIYGVELGKDYSKAQSGRGSRNCKQITPFINYLTDFITKKNINSIVEGSSGHWRSGWQSHVNWPSIEYYGVDLCKSVAEDNRLLLEQSNDKFGFAEASFNHGDILQDGLPRADLFLCKDTLIHFSNNDIKKFLQVQILDHPHKYKYLMCVNNDPGPHVSRADIPTGGWISRIRGPHFQKVRLSSDPFNLPTEQAFRYRNHGSWKIVEILASCELLSTV
jgi:hypothetical protein